MVIKCLCCCKGCNKTQISWSYRRLIGKTFNDVQTKSDRYFSPDQAVEPVLLHHQTEFLVEWSSIAQESGEQNDIANQSLCFGLELGQLLRPSNLLARQALNHGCRSEHFILHLIGFLENLLKCWNI